MSDNHRIEDLEVKCAFLEGATQELSDVLHRQQRQLDEALRRLEDLRQQLDGLATTVEGGPSAADPRAEIPPHY